MTTRGKTLKSEKPDKQVLRRPMITRSYELIVDHRICCGCRICAVVCPREAITLVPAALADGRLAERPRIDIDDKRCSFCGECVALCPTHALAMTVNGQPEVPVVKGNAFPSLIRKMTVDLESCQASSDTSYVERCPVQAIQITVKQDIDTVRLVDVKVIATRCINCTRCMEEGPHGGFTVTKPYLGRIWLNTALCPSGCQACADVCPSRAMSYDGQQVAVDRRYCLFCSACENVCPAPGAVKVQRTGFVHTPISSGAWMNAVDKLVSFREVAREYDVKSQAKRRKLMLAELHSPDETAASVK